MDMDQSRSRTKLVAAISATLRQSPVPLKAREISRRLRAAGWEIERHDVNSVLYGGQYGSCFKTTVDHCWSIRESEAVPGAIPEVVAFESETKTAAAPPSPQKQRTSWPSSAEPDVVPPRPVVAARSAELATAASKTVTAGSFPVALQEPSFALPKESSVLPAESAAGELPADSDLVTQTVQYGVQELIAVSHVSLAPRVMSATPPAPESPPSSLEPFPLDASATLTSATALEGGSHFEKGDLIGDGRYRLECLLGQGGMGCVYEARDLQLDRVVALKVVRRQRDIDERALENECKLLTSIDKPEYFPRVFEPFFEGPLFCVPMAFLRGVDLRKFIEEKELRDLDAVVVRSLFDGIADRLHYLHSFPDGQILFRDLKPTNIMVEQDDGPLRVRLIDFGIAAPLSGEGIQAGTKGFWAPEAQNEGRYSVRSDVYALGKVLLCLLAGEGSVRKAESMTSIPLGEDRDLAPALLKAARVLASEAPGERPANVRRAQDLVANAFETRDPRKRPRDRGTRICRQCGDRNGEDYRLCVSCGAWLRDVSAPDWDPPGWRTIESDFLDDTLSAYDDPARHVSPRRLDLIEWATTLSREPAYRELTCLPQINFEPYSYQVQAALKVLGDFGGRGILADEVGLGKTIEAGLVLKEYLVRREAKCALIVTPPGLRFQWRDELREKFGIDAITYGNSDDDDDSNLRVFDRDAVVIVSTYTARGYRKNRSVPERLTARPWDVVILDEAHHARPGGSRGGGNLLGRLFADLQARRLLLLTATPAQNTLTELYHLVSLLKPGILGPSRKPFERRFGGTHRHWEVRNESELKGLLRQVLVRNRRADVHKAFPSRRAHTLQVPLDRDQQDAYTGLVGALQKEQGGALKLVTRAQQFCTSFKTIEQESVPLDLRPLFARLFASRHFKLASFLERILPELREESKVLVFSRFVASQREIWETLRDEGVGVRWARGAPPERLKLVKEFRRDPGVQFLVCGASLSEGLNLQFCRAMVNFDLPWNPQQIEQRIGRIQRLGSEYREVLVFNLMARGTIEELVIDYLEAKLGMFEEVFGFVEAVLGQFSEGESVEGFIREALRRGREGNIDPIAARQGGARLAEARSSALGGGEESLFDALFAEFGADD